MAEKKPKLCKRCKVELKRYQGLREYNHPYTFCPECGQIYVPDDFGKLEMCWVGEVAED